MSEAIRKGYPQSYWTDAEDAVLEQYISLPLTPTEIAKIVSAETGRTVNSVKARMVLKRYKAGVLKSSKKCNRCHKPFFTKERFIFTCDVCKSEPQWFGGPYEYSVKFW